MRTRFILVLPYINNYEILCSILTSSNHLRLHKRCIIFVDVNNDFTSCKSVHFISLYPFCTRIVGNRFEFIFPNLAKFAE